MSSYVYLDDLVRVIMKGIESDVRNEIFNIAFKEPVTLTTLLLEMSQVLNSVNYKHAHFNKYNILMTNVSISMFNL